MTVYFFRILHLQCQKFRMKRLMALHQMIESIFFRWCKKLWANFPCFSPFVSIFPFQHACAYSSESYKQMPMKYKAVSACIDTYIYMNCLHLYSDLKFYMAETYTLPFYISKGCVPPQPEVRSRCLRSPHCFASQAGAR